MEQTAVAGANVSAIAGSNYEEDPPGSGIFVSTTGKDPYSYSVVSSNDKQSVIKIISAPKNRQSAVNRTFKITTSNLDNPNVQLLYASLLNLGKLTRLSGDTGNFKISNLTAEIMIVGQGFGYEQFFEEQHNKIKSLGHENADSTLVYQRAGLGVVNPQGNTLTDQLQDMVSKIETQANLQVVALLIFPGSVRYMAKENSLKYVHDVFEVPRDSDFVRRVNEMINSPQDPDGSDDSVQVTVDDSVQPARETFQAIPGEGDPGTMPGDDGECVLGFSLDSVLRVELGTLNFLEPVEYCPTPETGVYTLNDRTYVIAVEGDDYEGDYDKPVFKTEGS